MHNINLFTNQYLSYQRQRIEECDKSDITIATAEAVLKLKVNLGNCYTVKQNDPYMSTWQQKGYDSAWSGDGVNGKREEHCIKDPRPPRVQIVDVIRKTGTRG